MRRPLRPQSDEVEEEEESRSSQLKDPKLNELFRGASPIKIGFDRKFLVPNFQPLKFRSTTTTTPSPTTTRVTSTMTASTVAIAPTSTTDSTTAAILSFEPKRTNRRRSTTTPSPTSLETTETPYSTKAKLAEVTTETPYSTKHTTPFPFVEDQTAAPLRIVQSSSYVVVNGSHRNHVDHSVESERNYYPANKVKEGRNYDRKEELLEELIELLSESIEHRYKDKVSSDKSPRD